MARATSPFSSTKAVIAWRSVRRASVDVISSSRAIRPLGWPRELDRLPADGHRVVPEAFELDIGADHGRHAPQRSRARQVDGDELVAETIELAHLAVDPLVVEDGAVGEVLVAGQHRAERIGDGLLDPCGNRPEPRMDVVEIVLKTQLVVLHDGAPSDRPDATRGGVLSCTGPRAPARSPCRG